MARPLRITYPGAFYHVTSRGNERKDIFKSKRDRERFLEYLESATQRYNAVIHVYCMMDNHYHLLLETPSGNLLQIMRHFKSKRDRERFLEYLESATQRYNAVIHVYCMMDNHYHLLLETPSGNLPQIMRHLNGAYTTYFNVKRKRSGHLFQGRYKAILVDIDEYAKELSRYIHLNPVRAKMVAIPEAYTWSSYQFYIGKQKSPEWLYIDFILSYFGKKVSIAQNNYQQFVTEIISKKYDSPLDDVISSTLLGSPDFIAFIKDKYLSGKEPDKDIPALKELTEKVSVQDIFDEVEFVFGKESVLARNVKMFLCQRYTGEKLKVIGKYFGISESGVSQASRRISQKSDKDKKLKKKIEKIEKKFKLSRMKN